MGNVTFNELLGKSSSEDLLAENRTLSRKVRENPQLFDSLTKAADTVKGENVLTEEKFMEIVRADETLAEAATDKNFHDNLRGFLKNVIDEGKLTAEPSRAPSAGVVDNEPTETNGKDISALKQKLLAIIFDIPLAHPGDIITSEHHNSLRRAIKALASLFGEDDETTSIHTFAPLFVPLESEKQREEGDEGRHDWKLFVDKAVVPTVQEQRGAGGTVQGGTLIRLPDNVQVKSMIVRGRRVDDRANDPKSFDVTFLQVDPNKAKLKLSELIKFDLKSETGFFKRVESPTKSSIKIDNAKFHYYVLAVWEDEDDSSGFEVRSIQFICER